MKNDIEWKIYEKSKLKLADINEIERKIGFCLPNSYKQCILKYQEARPDKEIFDVKGHQRIFGGFLEIDVDEDDEESLIDYFYTSTDPIEGVLPVNVIPFSLDPGGNLICFDYKDNNVKPKVVFLDLDEEVSLEIVNNDWEDYNIDINDYESEAQAIEFLQRQSLQYVADSFEDFMNMLYSE